MKMKEVCQKTGLTERAVRYYIERGLIKPAATPSAVGRRTDYQFDSGHIARLRDIAALRECGFSIEGILTMQRDPSAIPGQIAKQMSETEGQEKEIRKRREILSRIQQTPAANVAELAEHLRRENRTLSLPDPETEPNFRRLDEMEGLEGGSRGEEGALQRALRREDRKRVWLLAGIGVLLVLALKTVIFLRWQNQRAYTSITTVSSATFLEKWPEEGELFAHLRFGEGSELAGITCTVRFESYPLYWAIVPGYEYIGATISAEVPLREGRRDGLIIEGEIPSVDIIRMLGDEELAKKYAVVVTVQGE